MLWIGIFLYYDKFGNLQGIIPMQLPKGGDIMNIVETSRMGLIEINTIKLEYLNGLYQDIANIIGLDSTIQIFAQFKGQQVTFPVKLFSKEYISDQIVSEFDGNNVKLLAKKYGYSERWVREIIRQHALQQERKTIRTQSNIILK